MAVVQHALIRSKGNSASTLPSIYSHKSLAMIHSHSTTIHSIVTLSFLTGMQDTQHRLFLGVALIPSPAAHSCPQAHRQYQALAASRVLNKLSSEMANEKLSQQSGMHKETLQSRQRLRTRRGTSVRNALLMVFRNSWLMMVPINSVAFLDGIKGLPMEDTIEKKKNHCCFEKQ